MTEVIRLKGLVFSFKEAFFGKHKPRLMANGKKVNGTRSSVVMAGA